MSPATHFLISWSAASCFKIDKKDRILVTIAGFAPDIDGMGLVYDLLVKNNGPDLVYWSNYHHALCHNIGFGLLLAVVAVLAAGRRWLTSGLVLLCFHLHLLCDILGSRGPDGYHWPVPYLEPFSDAWQLSWAGQWHLNGWQNFIITLAAICFVVYRTNKDSVSPLEMISSKLDRVFANAVQNRFQRKGSRCQLE